MTKREVLASVTFGKRIAEEEGEELESYFVETDQWKRVLTGDADVIYGSKGSGKSAMYSAILHKTKELLKSRIVVIPAENPRGVPIFKNLVTDPPASENEFRALWKMFFLSLVAEHLRQSRNATAAGKQVVNAFEEARLLPRESSLAAKLKSALDYVRRYLRVESVEGGIKIDPATGQPVGITGKIMLRDPDSAEQEAGFVSADRLFALVQEALSSLGERVWIALDRLDVAFAESPALESNGLRALFRVYLDLLSYNNLSLKIFLRSDIWRRITTKPFPEASHITRHITISWTKNALLNLIVRRLLHNPSVIEMYKVNPAAVLANIREQRSLFYRVFPLQVDPGPPVTLDWMLTHTCDGSRQTAPRELIHLLSSAQQVQLKSYEIGAAESSEEALFDRNALKEALPEVSKVRFEQTLCAEYPHFRDYLRKLEGKSAEQAPERLSEIWGISEERALELAEQLAEIGLFERHGTREKLGFRVPFLYRDALLIVQ